MLRYLVFYFIAENYNFAKELFKIGMVELLATKVNSRDIFEKYKEDMMNLLSEESKQKIQNKSVIACQPSLLGEIIVKREAEKQINIPLKKLNFLYTSLGKPYIEGDNNFHFNISHSKEWVVAAFSNQSVGVDVEKVRPINIEIAERFFSKEEYNDLIQIVDKEERMHYFFDIWTAKESLVKATGTGIANVFDTFSVQIREGKIGVVENNFSHFKFKAYNLQEGYKICTCSADFDFNNEIKILSINDLL